LTKVAGFVAAARGVDSMVTGWRKVWTGEQHETLSGGLLRRGFESIGHDPEAAASATTVTELLIDIGSTYGSMQVTTAPTRVGPTAGFQRYIDAERRISLVPQTRAEIEDALRLSAGQADLAATGIPRTAGRFGTAAHVSYESQGRSLNELLTTGRRGFSLGIEEFRDASGAVTARHAAGSLGLDSILYERGRPALGFDLKTGRAWSASELAERQRRFGISITQIRTR
jgi:hypothetical protein